MEGTWGGTHSGFPAVPPLGSLVVGGVVAPAAELSPPLPAPLPHTSAPRPMWEAATTTGVLKLRARVALVLFPG